MAMETPSTAGRSRNTPIVEVRNLQTTFFTDKETIRAVDGISFDIRPGETVGIVGESGSGKSVTARSLMGLVERPGQIQEGSSMRFHHLDTVRDFAERFPRKTVDMGRLRDQYDPVDLLDRADVEVTPTDYGCEHADEVTLGDIVAAGYGDLVGVAEDAFVFVTDGDPDQPERIESGYVEMARLEGEPQRLMRGGRIAMVFQDPLTSLNPVYTVGNQIVEALELHQDLHGQAARREAANLLEAVGIPDANRRITEYPHQFSGGMRQRAVIAMALACEPEVLICDEPTTALDVTIQAQILDLLAELKEERDLAIMFITHDMGVIAEVSDRVNVMYAGEIVETADVEELFAAPKHPYTQGLLRSIPGQQEDDRLETIEGSVPTPNEPATYCRFAPRCPKAFEECTAVHPALVSPSEGSDDRRVACLLYPEEYSESEAAAYHRDRSYAEGDVPDEAVETWDDQREEEQ